MNLVKKIAACLRDETADELLSSIISMGFNARLTDKAACKDINIYGCFGYVLGCIEVRDRNFDLIQVTRTGISSGSYSDTWYEFNFIVKIDRDLSGQFGSRPTWAKFKKKGFFPRRLIDVNWVGGQLTEKMNRDEALLEMLFAMKNEQRSIGIHINNMQKKRCVIITKSPIRPPGYGSGRRFPLMTTNEMELYNRIAMHVRLAG